jgi:DNA replication protein DnaC
VLIIGPCGTGKSHLAQALGHCAVRQGVDVVFTTCASLTQSLNAARATGGYARKLAMLARVPLLIIDDFGLKPLRAPAAEDLHDLIAERYEQAATIVTSNLDCTEWDQAFPANRLLAVVSQEVVHPRPWKMRVLTPTHRHGDSSDEQPQECLIDAARSRTFGQERRHAGLQARCRSSRREPAHRFALASPPCA